MLLRIFFFTLTQVFLVDRSPITYLRMTPTEPLLWTSTSTATATKYPMVQMKTATIHAGTSTFGMTFGCSDRTCLKVKCLTKIQTCTSSILLLAKNKFHFFSLISGYSGWQIIDSTPQEEAESVYHCGPASVEAVRRGEVGFQYDTPFMYCQLNAELCHFQEEDNSEWGFIRMASNQYQ